MKFFVVISLLICTSYVYCECPRREDLHCNFYDTQCQPGFSLRDTYITYKGEKCGACRICFPDSAPYGCPEENCPYKRIEDMYPMDCAVFKHPQKTWIDGRNCNACATFTKDCSNLSWTGR